MYSAEIVYNGQSMRVQVDAPTPEAATDELLRHIEIYVEDEPDLTRSYAHRLYNECKSGKDAAQVVYGYLRDHAKLSGYAEDYIILRTTEEGHQEIMWEEGPFDWAIALSGGSWLYAGESGAYSEVGEFPQGISGDYWHAEPKNSYTLTFYED